MSYRGKRRAWAQLVAMTMGTSLILADCDPSIQSTVEGGIIGLTNTVISAALGALGDAALQAVTAANNNSGSTTTTGSGGG